MDNTKMNADIRSWSKMSVEALEKSFETWKIEHVARSPSPIASKDSLKSTLGYFHGVISVVRFKFPRHMVFVAKGVGKGVPAAIAGTSATARVQKDWVNSVMDKQVDELADTVAENAGDMIVNSLRIR